MTSADCAHFCRSFFEEMREKLTEREKGCVARVQEVSSGESGASGEGVSSDRVTREKGIVKELH